MNLTSIQPVAFSKSELFDPENIMVEQETQLALKMDAFSFKPVVVLHSYVYHFKSVTVAVANFTREKNETRNNLSLYHTKSKHKPQQVRPLSVPLRECTCLSPNPGQCTLSPREAALSEHELVCFMRAQRGARERA